MDRLSLNFNARINNFTIQCVDTITEQNIKNTVSALLPLLSLNKQTAILTSLGCMTYELYQSKESLHNLPNMTRERIQETLQPTFFKVTFIALSIFFPTAGVLSSIILKLYTELKNQDLSAISKKQAFAIGSDLIYALSSFKNHPALTALSTASQAIYEIHEATNGLQQLPSSLKDGVKGLVSLIRTIQTAVYIDNAFLKDISPTQEASLKMIEQKDWDTLMNNIPHLPVETYEGEAFANIPMDIPLPSKVNIEELLKKDGFSNTIKGLHLHGGASQELIDTQGNCVAIEYTNLFFDQCTFGKNFFCKSIFENVVFRNCTTHLPDRILASWASFRKVNFINCSITGLQFENCEFLNTSFICSQIYNAVFEACFFFKTTLQSFASKTIIKGKDSEIQEAVSYDSFSLEELGGLKERFGLSDRTAPTQIQNIPVWAKHTHTEKGFELTSFKVGSNSPLAHSTYFWWW